MDNQIPTDFEAVDRPIPFKIFSGLLKAHRDEDGGMRLKGIASSSVRDRHGDTMTRSALEDMVRAANDNLTIFLNHSYAVPEDVAGSVETAVLVERGLDGDNMPIWDLDFDVRVNDANPRAVDAFAAIEKGTKLGLSIGAMIPEGGAVRDKKKGTFTFNHVDLLETSIVGIPANPRSWVSTMVKALKSTAPAAPEMTIIVNSAPEGDPPVAEPTEEPEAPPETQEVPEAPASDGSQGASESEPDTEPDDDVNASATPDDVSLATTLTALLETLEATASAQVELQRRLDERTEERDAARRERDEVAEVAAKVLSETSQIIEKLAAMPVGRKAVIRDARTEVSALERLYGPEVLKMIRSKEDDAT